MRRGTKVVAALVAVVGVGVGGYGLGATVSTPAEEAARSAAPEPSTISASVEQRDLSTNVVTRGTGRFGAPQTLIPPESGLKDTIRIVTSIADPSLPIGEGDVLATLSGRPVLILAGAVPNHRDLGPGMSGADVAQLEAALSRLGHDPGPIDGIFDALTEAGVTDLYRSRGFAPWTADDDTLAERRPPAAAALLGSSAGAGVQVPVDEIVFVAQLPLRIAEMATPVGSPVDGELMTVTDATVSIDTSVPVEEAGLLAAGMTVVIDEPDLGISAAGVISSVASNPGTNGVDGFHVYVEIAVDDAPTNLINASVRITVPIERTTESVLAVPVGALSLGSDGSARVERSTPTGAEVIVIVPGLSAQGWVEVVESTPLLAVGDEVVVGFEAS